MSTTSFLIRTLFTAAIAGFSLSGCSDACDNEDPRARIVNNGTAKASVQIKTSGGSTENINNIEVGQSSEWRTFAAGNTEFTVAVQGEDDTLVVVNMQKCYEYSIQIGAQNQVTSSATERE